MPDWAIKFDGKDPFNLEDLSPSELNRVAVAHGVTWLSALAYPASDPDLLADLCDLVATKVEAEPPGRQETAKAAVALMELLVPTATTVPDAWDDDGTPPVGEATTA